MKHRIFAAFFHVDKTTDSCSNSLEFLCPSSVKVKLLQFLTVLFSVSLFSPFPHNFSSVHLFCLTFIPFFSLLSFFNHNPTHDRDPNTSPPQQHTTFLPRLSNGGNTVAKTLWEWRGSWGATLVPWNTEVMG